VVSSSAYSNSFFYYYIAVFTEEVRRGGVRGRSIGSSYGSVDVCWHWPSVVYHQRHFSSDAYPSIPLLQWSASSLLARQLGPPSQFDVVRLVLMYVLRSSDDVPVPVSEEAKLSFVEPGRRWAHSQSPSKAPGISYQGTMKTSVRMLKTSGGL